jgi:hypothetical protein
MGIFSVQSESTEQKWQTALTHLKSCAFSIADFAEAHELSRTTERAQSLLLLLRTLPGASDSNVRTLACELSRFTTVLREETQSRTVSPEQHKPLETGWVGL